VTVKAGHSVPFSVAFTPQTQGSVAAVLSFVSNAVNAPTSEALGGTGTTAVQYSVNLSWNPSTSSHVAGYNIYRGTKPDGSYTRINSALNEGTTFPDNSVVSGTTYYYATTAVDMRGIESGYSNKVHVKIP
jgi:fibronectin type 3 domain-containing protein